MQIYILIYTIYEQNFLMLEHLMFSLPWRKIYDAPLQGQNSIDANHCQQPDILCNIAIFHIAKLKELICLFSIKVSYFITLKIEQIQQVETKFLGLNLRFQFCCKFCLHHCAWFFLKRIYCIPVSLERTLKIHSHRSFIKYLLVCQQLRHLVKNVAPNSILRTLKIVYCIQVFLKTC